MIKIISLLVSFFISHNSFVIIYLFSINMANILSSVFADNILKINTSRIQVN